MEMFLVIAAALHKVALNHTVNQLNRAMVLDFEPFRQVANGDFPLRL